MAEGRFVVGHCQSAGWVGRVDEVAELPLPVDEAPGGRRVANHAFIGEIAREPSDLLRVTSARALPVQAKSWMGGPEPANDPNRLAKALSALTSNGPLLVWRNHGA